MSYKKKSRLVTTLIVIAFGAGLLLERREPAAETAARQRALQALAPLGSAPIMEGGDRKTAVPPQRTVHAPATPAVLNMADVAISLAPSALHEQWLQGKIDLDEHESVAGRAEILSLQETARRLPPGTGIQIARSDPGAYTPSPTLHFDSMDVTNSGGAVPPDPELAAGPDHLIAAVNSAVTIYDKASGTAVFGPTAIRNLFTQPPCTGILYDPNVLYDEEADRWILAYALGPRSSSGGYCLLASQSGDPTGLWYAYFFPLNDGSAWLDYPHAGVGDNFIFMGGNYLAVPPAGGFVESRIHAFRKADLYRGNPVTAVTQGLGGSIDTPQPLKLHGYSTGTWPNFGDTHFFLGEPFDGANYTLLEWDTITLIHHGNINLGAGGYPVSVPQNGPDTIRANDWLPLDFEYRNGYGWTTMTIACNPGAGTVNCVRWAQIDLAGSSPPALGPAGSGVYASDGDYRFFPDLAVNHCNDIVIGYTKSSAATWPGVWIAGRHDSDPPGTLQAETLLKAGEAPYDASGNGPQRWGDYTGMTIDPDGKTFWYAGEYSKDTGTVRNWGTYIGSFSYGNCQVPAAQAATVPSVLTLPLAVETAVTTTLTLSNTGTAGLHWSFCDLNPTPFCNAPAQTPWVAVPTPNGTVVPGSTFPIDVTFDAAGLTSGVYTATLCIHSNDPVDPVLTIPLTMTVCAPPTAVTDLAITQNGSNVELDWSDTGAASYQVYRTEDNPYFTPAPDNLIGTIGSPPYTDAGLAGGTNHTYIVLATAACGSGTVTSAHSNRSGKFDFAIVPGG